jgi:hypothetical protein
VTKAAEPAPEPASKGGVVIFPVPVVVMAWQGNACRQNRKISGGRKGKNEKLGPGAAVSLDIWK